MADLLSSTVKDTPLWVARTALRRLIEDELAGAGVSQRELAALAKVDPKMVRKVLSDSGSDFSTLALAEQLLAALGAGSRLRELDVFRPA